MGHHQSHCSHLLMDRERPLEINLAVKRHQILMVAFLIDECACDHVIIEGLRTLGHDVETIDLNAKISDLDILIQSNTSGRILLTFDGDFGKLIFRDKMPSIGVVRMHGFGDAVKVNRYILKQISTIGDGLYGRFTSVVPKGSVDNPRGRIDQRDIAPPTLIV